MTTQGFAVAKAAFSKGKTVVCFLLGDSPASQFLYADVSEHSVPSS